MSGPPVDFGVRVPWDKLRSWIDAQVAREREHGGPAPLPQGQLEALSVLVSFGEEPDVTGRNYVSELMEVVQSQRLPSPVFQTEPVNLPVNGHIQLMWRCVCSTTTYGSFPREGHGVDGNGQPPAFQSKKNAKQYAAQQAMLYIKEESNHPVSVSSPTLAATRHTAAPQLAAKRNAAALSRSQTPCSMSPTPAHKLKRDEASPEPSPRRTTTPPLARQAVASPASVSSDSSASDSVFKQVADLAGRLGLDAPAYRLDPDPEMPNFFDGRAVFRSGGRTPPPGVGAVTAVLGKKQARLQIAEGVLEWLREEHRARDALVQSLWGTGPS
ncbi:ATP-dependent RNA helicase [Purpureocillium lavendulum]|uniref:ATP-dependent RNA helicase n=1 Tax=Purpureocillium lavendulum TaxID=1247861 RepID=A0AB34G4Q4_9HYPO|nr:ATP-dependent RNA helicase [Purpureocillium lavendulum]